jgi:hypothetical protein
VSAAATATAQIAYQPTGPAYTQSFDGLSAVEGVTHTWTNNVSLVGWYANFTSYQANTGSLNSSDPMSYGATGAGDRALGSIGTTVRQWALRLVNSGSSKLVEFNLAYTGEQWRRAGNAKTLTVEYKVFAANGGSVGATGYTPIAALSFTSPKFLRLSHALACSTH